ncbi:MAG: hydrogenase maturation protease [Caldilineaceae bacterium]
MMGSTDCADLEDFLFIAYGNPLRRDDGAGLALAEHFADAWRRLGASVHHISTQQLTPELAADIAESGAAHVLFFDTAANCEQEIQLRRLDAVQAGITLGHQFSPALLLVMARELYGAAVAGWLVTVPGVDFGHGAGFSPQVQRLIVKAEIMAQKFLAYVADPSPDGQCPPHHAPSVKYIHRGMFD